MSWIYAIAFEGDRYLMVYHPRRKGWEMPGGRVEEGESIEEASVREFREETGQEFVPLASTSYKDGFIFAGRFKVTGGNGEMRWGLFEALPSELSFPEVEYAEQVRWARDQLARISETERARIKS